MTSDAWPLDGFPAWADEVHRSHSGVGLGDFEVVRATPWSTVVRWNTPDQIVWGKAVCPGFAAECQLLVLLAERAPTSVLAPIAVEHTRGWMLLPHGGDTLKVTNDVTTWTEVLLGYADVQRSVLGAESTLLGIGCPDMRPHAAVGQLERMMERGQVPEHRWLVDAARRAADDIDLELIPATIQHDDLRPDNVFANGRIFDWGDASLAHPFASLLTALMPNRADRPGTAEDKLEMRDAYLKSWQQPHLTDDHRTTLDQLRRQASLACMLAPVGRIDTWLRAPAAALERYPSAVDRWVDHLLAANWD